MHNGTTWELPFGEPAVLELQTEWGTLALMPVEPGQTPRLELSDGSRENISVRVEKIGETVRVSLDPFSSFKWFRGWECRATLYVPRDVHAHVQSNAGSINVRDLEGCELGIKASAGKIDLVKVHGLASIAFARRWAPSASSWRAASTWRSKPTPAWARSATITPPTSRPRQSCC
jgi:hypothetical protein